MIFMCSAKKSGAKYATEHHATVRSVNPDFDGNIVGLVHPPTYLNKGGGGHVATHCSW